MATFTAQGIANLAWALAPGPPSQSQGTGGEGWWNSRSAPPNNNSKLIGLYQRTFFSLFFPLPLVFYSVFALNNRMQSPHRRHSPILMNTNFCVSRRLKKSLHSFVSIKILYISIFVIFFLSPCCVVFFLVICCRFTASSAATRGPDGARMGVRDEALMGMMAERALRPEGRTPGCHGWIRMAVCLQHTTSNTTYKRWPPIFFFQPTVEEEKGRGVILPPSSIIPLWVNRRRLRWGLLPPLISFLGVGWGAFASFSQGNRPPKLVSIPRQVSRVESWPPRFYSPIWRQHFTGVGGK